MSVRGCAVVAHPDVARELFAFVGVHPVKGGHLGGEIGAKVLDGARVVEVLAAGVARAGLGEKVARAEIRLRWHQRKRSTVLRVRSDGQRGDRP